MSDQAPETIYVLPQVALAVVLQEGVEYLKQNPDILKGIFKYYTCQGMESVYGQKYLDQIITWWNNTPVNVAQAWSFKATQVPSITVKLATESEDVGKEAISDYWGEGENTEIGVSAFQVNLDITLFGSKNTDEVLWLYHMVQWILYTKRARAEALGLQAHQFQATDYVRDVGRLPDHIYARSIRFTCTVQQFFDSYKYLEFDAVCATMYAENSPDNDEKVRIS